MSKEMNIGERLKKHPPQINGTYEWRLSVTE